MLMRVTLSAAQNPTVVDNQQTAIVMPRVVNLGTVAMT